MEKEMKSKKSALEINMESIIKECYGIVDESYLTTNDAKRIIDSGCKLLQKCEELRISRDKSLVAREKLRCEKNMYKDKCKSLERKLKKEKKEKKK